MSAYVQTVVGSDSPPVGAVMDFAGNVEPSGWLFCFGQSLPRTGMYAQLFAVIGTLYGAGDGSTTFSLPDFRGRVGAGKDNMGGTAANRLQTAWGVDGATLGANGGTESYQLTIAQMPAHTHGYAGAVAGGSIATGGGLQTGSLTTLSTGGNQAHPNVQPTFIVNKIIKYTVSGTVLPIVPGDGDVVGPDGGVADGDLAVFNGTSGKFIRRGSPRFYNAIGNPNFEVDQRCVGNVTANAANGAFAMDRWQVATAGTMKCSVQQVSGEVIVSPGTSFRVSNNFLRATLTTAQASLGVSDSWTFFQQVEGAMFRELIGDVHSISLLVRSSVADLKFAVAFRDTDTVTKSFTHVCSLGAANTWTLVTVPNVPVWPSGNWGITQGSNGYGLSISLAAGTTVTTTPDTWAIGNYVGATGMDNFASKPTSSTFDVAFVQHEPGPGCSMLIDVPFKDNLNSCMRYFQKTWNYVVAPATATVGAAAQYWLGANQHPYFYFSFRPPLVTSPTVVGYSSTSTTPNRVRDVTASTDRAVTAASSPGNHGFGGFAITGPNAAAWICQVHWTADTGF